jgi:ATP-dependent DNA helicase PIF1
METENTTELPTTTNRLLPRDAKLSEEQERAVEYAADGRNLLLVGKAGVGKSTTVYSILQGMEDVGRKYVVCAPTGVAAINVGGITVHRLISILNKKQSNAINNGEGMDAIVIDECSMLRADLFDDLDTALRKYSYDAGPFGGYQIILVGDPGQLPPVVDTRSNPEEAEFLKNEYYSEFFFSAACYSQAQWEVVELTQIFRQNGEKYPKLLNMIRSGEKDRTVKYLNNNHIVKSPKGVVLTARSADADEINRREVLKVEGEAIRFFASMSSNAPEYDWKKNEYPADEVLTLKVGAKVMIIKNIYRPFDTGRIGPEGGREIEYRMVLVNGDVGIIEELNESHQSALVYVERIGQSILIDAGTDGVWTKEVVVGYDEKQLKQLDESGQPKKIKGRPKKEPVAVFIQLPFRLAYAMTIHKSQGATISEPFTIDLRRPMFAPGQLYVALSRGTDLKNLNILGRVRPKDVMISPIVNKFLDGYTAGTGIKAGSTYAQLMEEVDAETKAANAEL